MLGMTPLSLFKTRSALSLSARSRFFQLSTLKNAATFQRQPLVAHELTNNVFPLDVTAFPKTPPRESVPNVGAKALRPGRQIDGLGPTRERARDAPPNGRAAPAEKRNSFQGSSRLVKTIPPPNSLVKRPVWKFLTPFSPLKAAFTPGSPLKIAPDDVENAEAFRPDRPEFRRMKTPSPSAFNRR